MNQRKDIESERQTQGTVAWLRKNWIQFFKKKGHLHLPSSSLIPAGDPTLLFTTAGMVPFKSYFSGTEEPPNRRVATIQKCIRTTDLERVGKTSRHCTFFEMLGNFSFGDYFKKEAIAFAYEFSIEVLGFEPERIYASVYLEDDEAESIWREEMGLPPERIVRLGKKDNWWGPAGDSGPCGPCTELYLDRGPSRCSCPNPAECKPGSDCERFLEYWNLVFNQYHQDTTGALHLLPSHGIDTGAGLERIAALLDGKESVYDTNELRGIISHIERLTGEFGEKGSISYSEATASPFRVIADHARSISFSIADGVHPDSTGRGYVIRRLIRRGLLFARELGIKKPVLHLLIPTIREIYSPWYPEIAEREEVIESIVLQEERRFLNTLEQGLRKWEEYLEEEKQKGNRFSGKSAFRLYDTFGFPLEMTTELAEKEGLTVDIEEFDRLMQEQADSARSASRWSEFTLPGDFSLTNENRTEFTGYENLSDRGSILSMVQNNAIVSKISSGEAILILDRSCFYAEGGGQKGDTGRIAGQNGALFRVNDTRKYGEFFLHSGEMVSGELATGGAVFLEIDSERREDLARHHSATHLLHEALRHTLGSHVKQTGSLVSPDYLRFDFAHRAKMSDEEIEKTEDLVNQVIDEKAKVVSNVLPIAEAKKLGAVAAFGEKYGEIVRVVSMDGNEIRSLEFCGGTHVKNSGDIRCFHIIRETSPGAGNRRIEAIAGMRVAEYFQEEFRKLGERVQSVREKAKKLAGDAAKGMTSVLPIPPDIELIPRSLEKSAKASLELNRKLRHMESALAEVERQLSAHQKREEEHRLSALLEETGSILESSPQIGSVKCVKLSLANLEMKQLRRLGDAFKERHRCAVVLLGNQTEKGPLLLFMANKNAVQAGVDCGRLIKETSGIIGGGGGGSPEMAQAGGKWGEHLDEALNRAEKMLQEMVKA